jgi:putative Mg2+ transporter-C (MgtC) family protein
MAHPGDRHCAAACTNILPPMPPDLLIFLADAVYALLLGTAIGIEREWRQHAGTMRTCALVSLGAMLFLAFAVRLPNGDPGHLAAQVVSGLGFLGGGVILRDGFTVRGLATSATLWAAGAVGVLVGGGFRWHAGAAAALIVAANLALRPVELRLDLAASGRAVLYELRCECDAAVHRGVRTALVKHLHEDNKDSRLNLLGVSSEALGQSALTIVAQIQAPARCDQAIEEVVARLSALGGVHAVRWKHVDQ